MEGLASGELDADRACVADRAGSAVEGERDGSDRGEWTRVEGVDGVVRAEQDRSVRGGRSGKTHQRQGARDDSEKAPPRCAWSNCSR